ncbi:hypothetical protein A9308_07410 [Moraxella atlantae]|uniref:Uncharacterized protein n=1 Tax=Faucicola atlantae TaxID=34059 RepID=A0A1B8QBC8_9GAMM|nr:WYL domain-containing protein [Moraxella atlantae]OBX77054.1 hypothetical protein A9308_07410 [Moraxella atlantae]OPH36058.1 hypothetical protein B5J92_04235 [Moraxella atlantae]STY94339.1 Uncharacterised protein [Moraxella atlantae]
MPVMSKPSAIRLLRLYEKLPRSEQKAKSIAELIDSFGDEKTESHAKALKSDLEKLAEEFGSDAVIRIPDWSEDVKGKTPKYYLHPDFTLDSYDNDELFFWEMLDKFTAHYLPHDIHQKLVEKIASVHSRQQKQYQASTLGQWKNHIIALPSLLNAPQFDNQVIATIQQAILDHKTLEFDYRRKWEQQPETKTIYPVGLVFIDNMIYLTGFYAVGDSIRMDTIDQLCEHRNFAINRIITAKIIDETIPVWVEKFNLDYLNNLGKLEYHLTDWGEKIVLKLKIEHYAGDHLRERPLSDDQTIERLDDDHLLLTATVMNSVRLVDWLVSMSQLSEVLEPIDVREAVKNRLLDGLNYYQ